jgi:FMN phosphatase YigB (HAD superfamily)
VWPARQFDESIRPLPGVTSGLAQMAARHWQVGAICNGPSDAADVRKKLARMRLEPYFAIVLTSRDTPQSPATRYQLAAEQFGVPPQNVLLISANNHELGEAACAGLKCLGWQLRVPPANVPVVQDFAELLRLVHPSRVPSLVG